MVLLELSYHLHNSRLTYSCDQRTAGNNLYSRFRHVFRGLFCMFHIHNSIVLAALKVHFCHRFHHSQEWRYLMFRLYVGQPDSVQLSLTQQLTQEWPQVVHNCRRYIQQYTPAANRSLHKPLSRFRHLAILLHAYI